MHSIKNHTNSVYETCLMCLKYASKSSNLQNRTSRLNASLRHQQSACSRGMLTTNTKAPVVPQTPVITDFLESLKIIPELHVKLIGYNLREFAILVIFLSVQKPIWNLELTRIRNHCHNIIQLCSTQFTSPHVHVNISFLTTNVSKSPTKYKKT